MTDFNEPVSETLCVCWLTPRSIVRLIVSLFVDEMHARRLYRWHAKPFVSLWLVRDIWIPHWHFIASSSGRDTLGIRRMSSASRRACFSTGIARLDVLPWFLYFCGCAARTISVCPQKRDLADVKLGGRGICAAFVASFRHLFTRFRPDEH